MEILVRLKNYETLIVDNLEAMHNEYVVAILHSAINIIRDDIRKELSMRPEYEVIGEESSEQVDYAIKMSDTYLHFFLYVILAILMSYFILSLARILRILFALRRINHSEM